MKNLVVDIDGTITVESDKNYDEKEPDLRVISKLRDYSEKGFKITLYTARSMRSYEGNVGKINIHTLPGILEWLKKHDVPFDEIIVGKPWCGFEGFYIDDKAIRPSEFKKYSYDEIRAILSEERRMI